MTTTTGTAAQQPEPRHLAECYDRLACVPECPSVAYNIAACAARLERLRAIRKSEQFYSAGYYGEATR